MSLVPWRGLPTPRKATTPAVKASRTPARLHPAGHLRVVQPPANTSAAARGPVGFFYAFVEMQQQIGRRKRAERAEITARLEAEYQRRQRLQLAPVTPRALPAPTTTKEITR